MPTVEDTIKSRGGSPNGRNSFILTWLNSAPMHFVRKELSVRCGCAPEEVPSGGKKQPRQPLTIGAGGAEAFDSRGENKEKQRE